MKDVYIVYTRIKVYTVSKIEMLGMKRTLLPLLSSLVDLLVDLVNTTSCFFGEAVSRGVVPSSGTAYSWPVSEYKQTLFL